MPASPNPALETWPYAQFGMPLRDPELGVLDTVARNEVDAGQKARNRYINPVLQGTYRLIMSNEVYLYFQAWHQHKLNNGVQWFNFKVRAGDELSWEEVRMTGIYQPQQIGRRLQITFSIIQRTHSIPSEAALDSYLG
jgi:hypothetical protein